MLLAVLGTALFYCDALITPAISVLSAVEGLELLDPDMQRLVVPVTLGDHRRPVCHPAARHRESSGGCSARSWWCGSSRSGCSACARSSTRPRSWRRSTRATRSRAARAHPGRRAGDPRRRVPRADRRRGAVHRHGPLRAQARAHRLVPLVWPGLLLNYFGQGALLLAAPTAAINPFFALVRPRALPFLIVLATAATIIASQATISGAFSVTRQAVQLDLLPRVQDPADLADAHGQIYVPAANISCSSRPAVRAGLPGLERALRRLRRGRDGHDGDHHAARRVVARAAWNWPLWRVWPCSACSSGRPRVRARQRDQDPERRLGAAGNRGGDVRGVRHLARRPRAAARRTAAPRGAARRAARRCSKDVDPRAGHRGVPREPPGYVPTALLRNLEHNRVCHETIVILHLEIQRYAAPGPRLAQLPGGNDPGHARSCTRASASWRRRT